MRKIIGLAITSIFIVNNIVSVITNAKEQGIENDKFLTFVAEQETGNDKIPEFMQPYTIIQYIDNNDYEIISGGEDDGTMGIEDEKPTYNEEIDIIQCYPIPFKGMTIYYGTDGQLSEIKDENGNNVEMIEFRRDTFMEDRENVEKSEEENHNKNNMSNKEENNTVRKRCTTIFNHGIGIKDCILEEKDTTIDMKYDNCKVGVTVYLMVSNMEKTEERIHRWHYI